MTGKFLQTALRTKQMLYNENGDLSRPIDSAPKKDLKQGEIDIRALQQKRQLAEITRYESNLHLQITDYVFVLAMTFELAVKIVANGLFFTPKAVVSDVGGVMTMFIYFHEEHFPVSHVNMLNSIFNCIPREFQLLRDLHLPQVLVQQSFDYFSLIWSDMLSSTYMVTILMIVVMFIFASFGVQIVGGKLASCNDPEIKTRL
uniref:Ion_trans domain-containing protein n=1 Tax=Heterorhabditis bacteriophora TaxID=37862 RepID=A0A1I7W7V2_HETBA